MTSRELERKSPEIETVIDRHLSLQTQLTTVGNLDGPTTPDLDARTQRPTPGVILWDKVLYNRASTATTSSSIGSERQVT